MLRSLVRQYPLFSSLTFVLFGLWGWKCNLLRILYENNFGLTVILYKPHPPTSQPCACAATKKIKYTFFFFLIVFTILSTSATTLFAERVYQKERKKPRNHFNLSSPKTDLGFSFRCWTFQSPNNGAKSRECEQWRGGGSGSESSDNDIVVRRRSRSRRHRFTALRSFQPDRSSCFCSDL